MLEERLRGACSVASHVPKMYHTPEGVFKSGFTAETPKIEKMVDRRQKFWLSP
jgi:hypothetical protein